MIQVINRAFDILEFCAKNPEHVYPLSEIADQFNIHHTTCANILKTLVLRNYMENIGSKKGYRLGSMSYQLTGSSSFRRDLVQFAKNSMEDIVEELNETCILAVLRKTDMIRVVLHQVHGRNELTVRTNIEKKAYKSATGRLLLSYLPEKEISRMVVKFGLPDINDWRDASTQEKLFFELQKIRKEGVIFQYDSNHIVGIAVPIMKEEHVIASICVYMPEMRFCGSIKELTISRLRQVSIEVSKSLSLLKNDL